MRKGRMPFETAGMLWLLSGLIAACDNTAEGVKQDTLAATAAASDGAEKARRELEQQVSQFKTQTNAKLEELSAAAAQLSAQTESGADLEKAKADLGAKLADLGKRLDATIEDVGDDAKDTVD